MLKFYGYNKCGSCQKAKKHLQALGASFEDIDITEKPPTQALLKAILKTGQYQLADLFNKSGVQYRELKMKDQIKTISQADAVKLLSTNGKLVKRPIVSDGTHYCVGYKPEVFDELWPPEANA